MNKSHSFKFGPGLPIAALPESEMEFRLLPLLSFLLVGIVKTGFLMPRRWKCKLETNQALMHRLHILHLPKVVMVAAPEAEKPGKTPCSGYISHQTEKLRQHLTAPFPNDVHLSFVSLLYLKVHIAPLEEEINTSNNLLFPTTQFPCAKGSPPPVPAWGLITLHRAAQLLYQTFFRFS